MGISNQTGHRHEQIFPSFNRKHLISVSCHPVVAREIIITNKQNAIVQLVRNDAESSLYDMIISRPMFR